jgi:L-asparaginase/Glu-tRNA(Gln) amidotransferase subunit D
MGRLPLLATLLLACAAAQAQQPPPGKPAAEKAPAAEAPKSLPVVRLIATGGTIAM